jgi:Probable cobalt transporter subunit (CbtA)
LLQESYTNFFGQMCMKFWPLQRHPKNCERACQGGAFRTLRIGNDKRQWKERGIRRRFHLTISGCLGPCPLANVVLVVFRGHATWFHSINNSEDVGCLYRYVERMLLADSYLSPPAAGLYRIAGPSRSWPVKLGGLVCLVLPHVIGAPLAVGASLLPASLTRRFVIASLAASGAFWLTLGSVGESIYHYAAWRIFCLDQSLKA